MRDKTVNNYYLLYFILGFVMLSFPACNMKTHERQGNC